MRKRALISRLAALWLLTYTGFVWAATTLTQDIMGYDYESFAWAAAAGLMGGVARTILWLASDAVVVVSIWRQLLRDAVFALIGGLVTFVLIQWAASVWPSVFTKELRLLLIVGAGFSRGRWQTALGEIATDALANARNKIRSGGPPPPTPPAGPSSVSVPLSDK